MKMKMKSQKNCLETATKYDIQPFLFSFLINESLAFSRREVQNWNKNEVYMETLLSEKAKDEVDVKIIITANEVEEIVKWNYSC